MVKKDTLKEMTRAPITELMLVGMIGSGTDPGLLNSGFEISESV